MVVLAQAAWASKTVKLAAEPPGERSGMVGEGRDELRLVAVGDSIIAGCGVEDQADSLTPRLAVGVAEKEGKRVSWETHAQLGATMKRVRYRFLPEIDSTPDILFVCAGSNDVMARRSIAEWADDLQGALDEAQGLCDRVWVCSSGQPHRSPVLPRTLRNALEQQVNAQTEASVAICAERGIPFADVTHIPLPPAFWASDGFHPSAVGYEVAKDSILAAAYS
ncbi:SGNH/GDSL hydrolase family protein [Actinomycetaceae bacterium MB13-C1-2]|nr:SGNH/GDSL hydrolase family protein [Actinomycetaceae bacterium MB13-C1-2]